MTPSDSQLPGDVHRASASVKSHLPGSSPNAEKELKGYGEKAGAQLDKAVCRPSLLRVPCHEAIAKLFTFIITIIVPHHAFHRRQGGELQEL